jgi:glutathione synthase
MSVSVSKKVKQDKVKNSKLNFAFIADGVKNFSKSDIFHDSSFALMLASQSLNVNIFLSESNNLKIINNKVFAKFDKVRIKQVPDKHVNVLNTSFLPLDSFNAVFARKDPPIDENYLSYIQMLTLVSNKKTLIVNNPEGILKTNEKLYALKFPKLTPPTLITNKKDELVDFLDKHKEAVIKPLFDKSGSGVFYLNKNVKNANAIIESSIHDGNRVALIQKYIPQVLTGDKRIILLNGEPIGAMLRIPKKGELRANMSRGASIKPAVLTKRDLEICEALKPHLIADKLYFAGIDVIGGYLTEVNVTSPTGLQEIERFTGRALSKEIIEWVIEQLNV